MKLKKIKEMLFEHEIKIWILMNPGTELCSNKVIKIPSCSLAFKCPIVERKEVGYSYEEYYVRCGYTICIGENVYPSGSKIGTSQKR